MADHNAKSDLSLMKLSTQGFSRSLIMILNYKFYNLPRMDPK